MRGWLRYRFRGYGSLLSVLCGVGLALTMIHRVNLQIRPMMVQLAGVRVNNEVVRVLDEAVEELPLSYDTVVTMEKDTSGRVTALKSDMKAIGQYRAQLVSLLTDKVDRLKTQTIRIPLGSLSGIDLLSGRGPGVPVKVLSIGAVRSEFENEFTSAGINQTLHRILLTITVTADLLLPGAAAQREIQHQLCVAETVIVGAVPDHYANIGLDAKTSQELPVLEQ